MAGNQPTLPGLEAAASSSIAARVAERYSRVPSYRDMLAAQAAAKAAAEAAEAAVRAAAEAAAHQAAMEAAARAALEPQAAHEPRWDEAAADSAEAVGKGAHGRPAEPAPWQPDLIRYSVCSDSLPALRTTPAEARAQMRRRADTGGDSVAGILDPLEEALVEPASPLPARVIEFPRELVAPRKARPRLAEGPLREDGGASADSAATGAATDQELFGAEGLRIFEAEPESPAVQARKPLAEARPSVPEWQSIQLDSEGSRSKSAPGASPLDDLHLHVASLEDRAMAGVVDVALTLAAFLVFVLVFAVCTTHLPGGHIAATGAAITLLAMWILYQLVFFGLSDATPGMRYAKIALCTFDDENPTRTAMRGRIGAMLLSALPLGLGFLWALFDEDALGWHDRITQTYQRSYRDF